MFLPPLRLLSRSDSLDPILIKFFVEFLDYFGRLSTSNLGGYEPIRKVERKRFEKILSSQHEVEIEPNLNKLARANFEGVPKNHSGFWGCWDSKDFEDRSEERR